MSAETLAIVRCRAIASPRDSHLALIGMFLQETRNRGTSETTLRKYTKVFNEFFLHLGDLRPAEIRPRDIREYIAYRLNRGASTCTLMQELSALRSLFRFAEAMEIVPVSPARSVQTRRYSRKLPKALSQEDINRLIDSQDNLRDKTLLELMYSTGARVNEVSGMRVADVDWTARTVLVNGKGAKQRLIPLNVRAVQLLKEYLGNRTEGWLFQAAGQNDQHGHVTKSTPPGWWLGKWRYDYQFDPAGKLQYRWMTVRLGRIEEMSRQQAEEWFAQVLPKKLEPRPRPVKDQPLDPTSIRYIVRKAGFRAGIKNLHPHTIRHSFATHMYDGGADILTISRFLGHVSLTTTQIYTHVSTRKLQETLERFHPRWGKNENES